jgi:hypothetical protein
MSDVFVPKVMLKGSSVMAFIGKLEAAGVAKHVRMDREWQLGLKAGAGHELANIARGHRTAALRDKQVRAIWPFATELPQCTQFWAA